jgi:outer membrane protein assembly factor BamB
MQTIKNKTIATMISLVLLTSMVITLVSLPTVSAGYSPETASAMAAGMHWPPTNDNSTVYRNASATRLLMWTRWQDQVPTAVFISATPKLVGVGQEMTFIYFNPQVPNPSSDKYLFTLTIARPDGTNETLPPTGAQGIYNQAIQDGKYVSDTTGSAWARWVPTVAGNYTVTVKFWGTTPSHTDPTFTGYDWWGVTLKESSYTTTFTVQDEAIPPLSITTIPLPTEFWSRPIEGQNTMWYQVSSNWLNNANDKNFGGYNNKFQPDGIAPNSGHILWTKQTEDGGVVGGTDFKTAGETFNAGHQYQTRFPQQQIIMQGRLYYRESNWYSASPGDYVCVDLQTGQEIWRNASMAAIPTFGYYYGWDDMNQHGVVEPSWLFADNYALGIHPRLGITNGLGLKLNNVPAGTAEHSHNNVIGPDGEDLRYTIGGNATNGYFLTQWNSSRVFISQVSGNYQANVPITPERPTDTPSTIMNWTGTAWTQIPRGTTTGSWTWNGTAWMYASSAAMTAATWTASTNPSYDWNVTISPKFSTSPTIRATIFEDIMLVSNGSIPSAPTYTIADSATFWALNLNPAKGLVGALLWGPITIPLINSDNQQLMYQAHDPVNGVFMFQQTPDMSWVGYDIYTGAKLWNTISEGDLNPYAYYISSTGYNPEGWSVAYGKLYSTGYVGIVFAYDTKTGDLLWKHESPTYMEKFEYYTLMINAIADGKIYIGTHEHSADTPLFKGAKTQCLNATTGEPIWEMLGWANPYTTQVADGVLTYWNNYDSQVYAVGKGPSQMTVSIADDVIASGSSVMIKGTVIDVSAGTKQKEQAARFPLGVPAVSDSSQSAWMEYVYMQKPRPMSTTGVPIALNVVDANGNYRQIGSTTSDADGFFAFNWKPDIDGQYTVYASFAGSESYWPSHAVTAFSVDAAAPTPSPTAEPVQSTADMYFVPATAGLFVLIIIVLALLVLMMLKKRA